ncbi:dnaJ homolog subfamily B member 4-like [Rhopalosiphum padi]|uniref:dnaJ homolog subfamily B member 4-like n=1 Tax=Rhopalosiphum padi TaxID=40932 RepID=UPI00298EB68F|nr:dnaJ homolog subfamily B member 4-like [Rhopalosiphum padi]
MNIDYYSILNLKRHCTKDDIHIAFGKLVKSQVQNCCLVKLCEAYEVLSDPFRRAIYNEFGEEGIKKGVKTNDLYIGPWTYHCDVISTYS